MTAPFLVNITVKPDQQPAPDRFPGNLPFVPKLDLALDSAVTFFVGENGSGKSTLLEAVAVAAGFPMAGGSRNELAAGHGVEETNELAEALRPSFRERPRDGYFFRAELQANFAALLDQRRKDVDFREDPYSRYGGKSLHAMSHGEAFLAVMAHRFQRGLFLLDEPESALSPQRQLSLLALMHRLVESGKAQFIVATHSPILLTYPKARILSFDEPDLKPIDLEDTSHFQITTGILENPAAYWKHLGSEE